MQTEFSLFCSRTNVFSSLSNLRHSLLHMVFHVSSAKPFVQFCFCQTKKTTKCSQVRSSEVRPSFGLKMEDIAKVWLGPLPPDSPYVKPFRLYFVQNGVEKNWDLLKVHDSVAIIIFNKKRNVLVFVKQFRPAVYHGVVTSAGSDIGDVDLSKFPPKLGVTLELCAGIVDKDKTWVEIAKEEILEECGYDVPVEKIEEVMTFRSGVGSSGSQQKMYYCEVTDDDKVASGGGVDGEIIEVVEYSLENARKLVSQGAVNNSPPGFLFGVLWFLTNKAPKA